MSRFFRFVILAFGLVGLSMGANCIPGTLDDQSAVDNEVKISAGRMNAARALDSTGAILVDVVQFAPAAGQDPSDPFGVHGGTPWPSRIGGPVTLPLATLATPLSEYDLVGLSTSGNTARVLSIRVPTTSVGDQEGTVVEFNFRAVNPFAKGHDPADPVYTIAEGKYPSNDSDLASRSLVDLMGGPVAVLVRGLKFKDAPVAHTQAVMRFQGPAANSAWLGFMRDNAWNSGRFYALAGSRAGGPVALADIAGMEGPYQSVQINGADLEPMCDWSPSFANGMPYFPMGGLSPYSFADLSNLDATGNVVGGLGGFVFVIRPLGMPVVVDPSQPIGAPGNLVAPPLSGYDEVTLAAFTGDTTFHTPVRKTDGPPGVHELSVAVYFWHPAVEEEEP